MPDIKSIPDLANEGTKAVIEELENAIERAKEGKITGVCIVEVYKDVTWGAGNAGYFSSTFMLGALERAKDFIKDRDEDA